VNSGTGAAVPATDSALAELSAIEALALLRSGRLTAERYAQALIAVCHARSELRAFISFDGDRVLDAARAADRGLRHGMPGVLHGLPVVIKDNIDVAGVPTTAGTPALRANWPLASAPVAEALFRAGAILLGKANMHELADGITNNNAAFGAVRNPYAPAMIPGGSSGGTAAAIAARLCAAGLGTDTGGSVRIPAALCGIAGLRPSSGRYPGAGIVPISHTRDTAGPMARTVADVALLDAVISGAAAPPVVPALRGVRLGVPQVPFYEDLDPELAAVIEAALEKLVAAGCVLIPADLPELASLSRAAGAISYYEQPRDLDAYLAAASGGLSTREVAAGIASPDVRAIFETDVLGATAISEQAYRQAMDDHRPRLQAAYARHFDDLRLDALALPTTVLPARPIGEDRDVELNGRRVPTFATYLRNTRIMTIAGIPGLSLPAGLTAAGLPVGLELDAPAGTDRALLGLGMAVEAVLGCLPSP
jgi:Asp-tRNA(Asn)/Glu-tRNA(Gln) amidotransferase A subunit family amidase